MNGKYMGKLEQRWVSRDASRLERIHSKQEKKDPRKLRYVMTPAEAERQRAQQRTQQSAVICSLSGKVTLDDGSCVYGTVGIY